MSIEVVAWSPRWAEQYDAVAAVLHQALAGIASATVEHVGSTSVPGLAAKPILDIDVIVESQDVTGAIAALESVGWEQRTDFATGSVFAHAANWWHDDWGWVDVHVSWPGVTIDHEEAYDVLAAGAASVTAR